MQFTELADYPISAGVLTEWLPCAEDDAWQQDSRPASYIHEAHLRRSSGARYGGGRESWLGTAFEIDGEIDTEKFRRALERWIDRHEPLRSHTRLTGSDRAESPIIRRTAPPGRISLRSIRHDPSDPDTIRDHLHGLFDDYTTPHLWPAYVFATLERLPGDSAGFSGTAPCFTVFFGADHSIIDGYSIVLVAHEITALYEEERTGRPAELFPVGSYIDFGAAERDGSERLDDKHEAVRIWQHTLKVCGGHAPSFPLPIGPRPPHTVAQQGAVERWFDDKQASVFAARCQDSGAGFFAGVLACLGQATRELAGVDNFRVVAPAHTRTGPMWAGALGWFVGVSPIDLDLTGTTDFDTLTARAARELRRTRASARVPFDRVGELLGVPIRPRFVVSYMDVRFVPMAAQWPEWNARALRSRSFAHDVYIWINRTPEGLNMSARFPDNPVAAANVLRFLHRTRELMHDVVASSAPSSGAPDRDVPPTGE
ncbi:condensation domain-containing protein [Rhodococcus sp. DT1]|uniref:condensation domain-containing protein n=1 Tax=Rhodococcus sp. DT1 TaxID=3416544 RepID=UPI003CE9062C